MNFGIGSLLFTAFLITNVALYGHGFGEGTLVRLDDSWQDIATISKRTLEENIYVLSYDTETETYEINPVKRSGQSTSNCYIRFGFDSRFEYSNHNEIICTPTQEFYVVSSKTWIPSQYLRVGDNLLSLNGKTKKIAYIQYVQKAITVYTLEVSNYHTFFVGNPSALTHNMVLPMAFSAGFSIPIGCMTGGGLSSIFGPVACTFGMACGSIIGACATLVYGDTIPKYTITNNYNPSIFYANEDAQAPGKPTEKDGYKPPKRWDGKKVKHPKNGKVGWPDHKGNVWVPTGPGPMAHGGAHWDVQHPNGKDYENIYPGGKKR